MDFSEVVKRGDPDSVEGVREWSEGTALAELLSRKRQIEDDFKAREAEAKRARTRALVPTSESLQAWTASP